MQAVSLWASANRIPADRLFLLEAIAREKNLSITAEMMRPDLAAAAA